MDKGIVLIEDLVILAAEAQSGTDVVPINLIAEIRMRKPDWSNVRLSHFIDELDSLSLGTIRPIQNDPGGREFLIGPQGASFAREVAERRRSKTLLEKLGQWTRTDWIALGALAVSILSLVVSILALSKPEN